MAKNQVDNFRENLRTIIDAQDRGAVSRLAEEFGVHRVSISRKLGGFQPFALDEAQQIAEHFGYTLSDLLVSPRDFKKNLVLA